MKDKVVSNTLLSERRKGIGEVPRSPNFAVLSNRILRLMPTDEPPTSNEASAQGMDSEKVRDISLEEFEPYGTLAVTGSYFVLLLVLYALLYFVEFAAKAPHIIE